MPTKYGQKTIRDLSPATPVNLRNDYFIITRDLGDNNYQSFRTTFKEISSALCSEIKDSIVKDLDVNVDIGKLRESILDNLSDLSVLPNLTSYLGSAQLLNQLLSLVNTKASATSSGTTYIGGTYVFNDACPQTPIDPSDPNDLVRQGYLSELLEDSIYCDVNQTEELYATEVLTGDVPGAIKPEDTCPIVIQNDKNAQVKFSIAGSSLVSGIFLYSNPNNLQDFEKIKDEIKNIAKSASKLKLSAEFFTLLDSDKAEGYSYNTILPIKAGQIICIFPKVVRTKIAYNYLKWSYSSGTTTGMKKYNNLVGYTEWRDVTQSEFKARKSELLQKQIKDKPAKFRVMYDKYPNEKVYRYYYTSAAKTNVAKIVPTVGNFLNGTDIEVLQFI